MGIFFCIVQTPLIWYYGASKSLKCFSFWSIVFNGAKVYIHKNFLKIVVYVIIIDQ